MKVIVQIKQLVHRLPELRFNEPINWTIREGEQWAIVGPNGAGKTLLADTLLQKFAIKEGEVSLVLSGKMSEQIKSISFRDIYSLADCRNAYYQQRWHSTEVDDIPLVRSLFPKDVDEKELSNQLDFFDIKHLMTKKLIHLSSGELRKFLIVRVLLTHPSLLILDNPFIGLDIDSRRLLNEMFEQIAQQQKVQIVLLLSSPDDIPAIVTHVLPVINKMLLPVKTRSAFLSEDKLISRLFPSENKESQSEEISLPVSPMKAISEHNITLRMEKVSVRYGNKVILDNLDWEVRNGESWALLGANGSGKSTLLSLVCADNPQAYGNTFYLFDRKRGTGESIWDIKKRIGYVSPEMHLYYQQNLPTIKIVGSGFFDSIGLYRSCSLEQEAIAVRWMEVMGVAHLQKRPFLTLSSGEQRLVLLARAFVKDPDLLILDEPLHGLDIDNKRRMTAVIKQFVRRPGKTLIYVTHYPQELSGIVDHSFSLKK